MKSIASSRCATVYASVPLLVIAVLSDRRGRSSPTAAASATWHRGAILRCDGGAGGGVATASAGFDAVERDRERSPAPQIVVSPARDASVAPAAPAGTHQVRSPTIPSAATACSPW